MFKSLTIEDKEYQLPKSYTCAEWTKLNQIGITNMHRYVSEGFDIPLDKVQQLPDDIVELGAGYIMSLCQPIVARKPYKTVDLEKLTLGQFIDCEVAIESDVKDIVMLSNVIFEEKVTNDTPVEKVYDGYIRYNNYRNLLYYKYKSLFNIDDTKTEVVEDKPSKTRSNAHVWYDLVMLLGGGEFLNIDEVVNRPVIEAFNWLAWNKDKRTQEAQAAREQQQKIKNRR